MWRNHISRVLRVTSLLLFHPVELMRLLYDCGKYILKIFFDSVSFFRNFHLVKGYRPRLGKVVLQAETFFGNLRFFLMKFDKKLIFKNGFFVLAVRKKAVSEFYAFHLGFFWH